jgi:peptide deformylase
MNEKIVQKGDHVLKEKTKEIPVAEITGKNTQNIIQKMKESLSSVETGAALAAPQIGISSRIFIVKKNALEKEAPETKQSIDSNFDDFLVFINPQITKLSKKTNELEEGCLSVEGIYGTIARADKVTIEAYDENGQKISRGASGLLAQIFQHEVDHLDGVLFVDKASNLFKPKQ